MKNIILLLIAAVVFAVNAQWPQCDTPDCATFTNIVNGCGFYEGPSLTEAQLTCVCDSSGIVAAYKEYVLNPNQLVFSAC
jgi:hypothetical protein